MALKKFVFVSHCKDIEFFNPVKVGMEDAARMLGVDVSFIGTKDIDIVEQKLLLQNVINEKVDGIALAVTHETEFDPLIEQALAKNLPLVCFNTDASNGQGKQLATLVQNTYLAGKRLGQFMAESINPGDKVLLTLHSDGIDSLESRKKGIMDGLSDKNILWDFITTGNGAEMARNRIKKRLKEQQDIKFVFGTGQDDTEGAGCAVADLECGESVMVCGFDLAPETIKLINQGIISAVVDQQPYMQGFYPVLQLYHYIEKGILPSDMDAGSNIITREKLYEMG